MAKKAHVEEPLYVEASLKIQKDKFVELLNTQIEKGEKLLQTNVPVVASAFAYGGLYPARTRDHVEYDEAAKKPLQKRIRDGMIIMWKYIKLRLQHLTALIGMSTNHRSGIFGELM